MCSSPDLNLAHMYLGSSEHGTSSARLIKRIGVDKWEILGLCNMCESAPYVIRGAAATSGGEITDYTPSNQIPHPSITLKSTMGPRSHVSHREPSAV